MSTTRRSIAIYIHPDDGPIMPMELDMLAVETLALSVPAGSQREDVRFREIARRIRDQFPEVDPESNWRELRSIMGRLSHFDLFNGIVLRLPGKIKMPVTAPAQPSQATISELNDLTKKVQQLSRQLSKVNAEHDVTKTRLYTQESENKRLKTARDKLSQECSGLQVQTQRDQETIERARLIVKRLREELEAAQRETAGMQTELEQVRNEFQANSRMTDEISILRQQTTNAQKTEQQLRETLAQRDQAIQELQDKIRELTEDISFDEGSAASASYI
jgi:hypothetical protein